LRTKVSTKKEEAWKYTSLNAVLKKWLYRFPETRKYCTVFWCKILLHEIDSYKIVFIDGVLVPIFQLQLEKALMFACFHRHWFVKIQANLEFIFSSNCKQRRKFNIFNTAFANEGRISIFRKVK
jgi:Fe-S cluster assembly protein SufD